VLRQRERGAKAAAGNPSYRQRARCPGADAGSGSWHSGGEGDKELRRRERILGHASREDVAPRRIRGDDGVSNVGSPWTLQMKPRIKKGIVLSSDEKARISYS
jgi:hypothetical protein